MSTDMNTEKKYETKGLIFYFYAKDGLQFIKRELDQIIEEYTNGCKDKVLCEYIKNDLKERKYRKTVYDVIPGKKFLEFVDYEFIIDEDGDITDIFIDGYISNLGLIHNRFCQGQFLVDKEAWLEICNRHKVEVNWANK